jgi:hypothetical protein
MARSLNLAGQRFGRLLARTMVRLDSGERAWWCLCDCGAPATVPASRLTSGNTRSCGCLQRDMTAERSVTHGQRREPEYRVWSSMIQRCTNPNSKDFADYGGRGIAVHPTWLAYEAFIADMGRRPSPSHSIDRLRVNEGYQPDNCRWATAREQARNTRRNRFITHDGRTQTLVAWSEETGIAQELIRARIDRCGWSPARALTAPVDHRKGPRKPAPQQQRDIA